MEGTARVSLCCENKPFSWGWLGLGRCLLPGNGSGAVHAARAALDNSPQHLLPALQEKPLRVQIVRLGLLGRWRWVPAGESQGRMGSSAQALRCTQGSGITTGKLPALGWSPPPISCAHTWALVPDTHSCCKAMRLHWEEGHQDAEQLMPQGAGGGPRVGACRSVVFGQARSYLAVFPEPQPLFPMSPAVTGGVVFPGVLGRK